MAYVINEHCIDELDGSCVENCPVDCIYEGLRKRYIQPDECIDCGACLPECPVDAIIGPDESPDPAWAADNVAFFAETLPGRDAALALARAGFTAHIVERSPEFGEIGAGIQLAPNALRILDGLGVLPELMAP